MDGWVAATTTTNRCPIFHNFFFKYDRCMLYNRISGIYDYQRKIRDRLGEKPAMILCNRYKPLPTWRVRPRDITAMVLRIPPARCTPLAGSFRETCKSYSCWRIESTYVSIINRWDGGPWLTIVHTSLKMTTRSTPTHATLIQANRVRKSKVSWNGIRTLSARESSPMYWISSFMRV